MPHTVRQDNYDKLWTQEAHSQVGEVEQGASRHTQLKKGLCKGSSAVLRRREAHFLPTQNGSQHVHLQGRQLPQSLH